MNDMTVRSELVGAILCNVLSSIEIPQGFRLKVNRLSLSRSDINSVIEYKLVEAWTPTQYVGLRDQQKIGSVLTVAYLTL